MRGTVLHAPGDVRWEERTDPAVVEPTDAGAVGTIVEVFDRPERAYEVEFSDPAGNTLALVTLQPDEVRAVED